jgi:hypothetical protein
MTVNEIKKIIEDASGVRPMAILTPSGKRVKDLQEVYNSSPLPNYSGLFLAKSGVYVWDIYKDKEWRIRVLGPDAEGKTVSKVLTE